MFCEKCGTEMSDNALACPKCGEPTKKSATNSAAKSRIAYQLLALFLGGLGIHNFYAGRWFMAIFEPIFALLVPFVAGMADAPALMPAGYIFIGILILVEIFTVKKDGKGVPFA